MQQMSLFNTSSHVSGFRLDYLEIWNWGTFDKEVFRIDPRGNNTLLTGANASGKSTLIDALLTLLVPLKRNRFYNQSSGIDKKGDRTEESYFYGNYGNQQQEGAAGTRTLRFRDKSSRSVLLACFKSAEDKIVTLFQVRYFAGEELKTVYGIGRTRLEIKADLTEFDSKGVWRRHLEKKYNANSPKRIVEFCNGPVEYGERLCDLFGMKSNKALQLFNQITGVKVLDDLNQFIQDNMLDEMDAEGKYIELKQNFQNLMEAKLSIDKANQQIHQLEPIVALAKEMDTLRAEIKRLEEERSYALYWFTQQTITLSQSQLEALAQDLTRIGEELSQLEKDQQRLDEERTNLKVAIGNDEVGKQIRELEEAIHKLEADRNKRRQKAELYNSLATRLQFPTDPDRDIFQHSKKEAEKQKEELQTEVNEKLTKQKLEREKEKQEISDQIEEHIQSINYLEMHRHNIPDKVAEIRDNILQHTGATPDEMPFVGELIQVKEEEQAWELSIERILHHFALRLIVPEAYYNEVNQYVNSHNLHGKIVYQPYQDFTSLKEMEGWDLDDNSLLHKIDIKPGSRYTEWVEDFIYRQYNYACVNDLTEFGYYQEKAVTQNGLIKSTQGKHEKDDRPHILNRENFVLGWDNSEKIRSLREGVRTLQNAERQVFKQIEETQAAIQKNKQLIEELSNFHYAFTDYDDIDWRTYAQYIQEKTEAKQHLEDSNDTIKTLQSQLAHVETKLSTLQQVKDKLQEKKFKTNFSNDELKKKLEECRNLLQQLGEQDLTSFEEQHPELADLQLDQLEAQRIAFQSNLKKSIDSCTGQLTKKENKATLLIHKFKNPEATILEKFRDWRSDVSTLPEGEHLELISEYEVYYTRLVNEDLISFQDRFEKYLQETIMQHIASFRMFFNKWKDSILQTIKQLNTPLQEIDFDHHPNTYIQLIATKKQDIDIQQFVTLMQEALPNQHQNTSKDFLKQHFENHIEPFIRKLEEESWRNKVMDVRAWFTYKAEEFYKENQQKRKTYESMGQLSGGEKAQLTYTILGSAIANQFGLTRNGLDSSFRFIAIDEAFKAQDEEKANYLLSLCQQLHLQLLVVTPSDNIHIVENHISYVHYVERQGDRSVLYNMPIMQYKEERKKHETT